MAYKVVFIDEEHDQHESFQDYMDAVEDLIKVVCIYPEPDLEDMIQKIEEQHPDAIVTDYLLNDMKEDIKYNVAYTGVELVHKYRSIRTGFPCFIITSFDNDAVSETDDVNLIYIKHILNNGEEGAKAHFYDKIREQISKYKLSITSAQSELEMLVQKKDREGLEPYEELRALELDGFLEKALDSHKALPSGMKEMSYMKNMTSMIDKVDELLAKLG